MTPPKNITNVELYQLLSDISGSIGEINGKLDGLVSTQTKTIYALIALAGATVGLKLVSSPPPLIISSFLNAFIFLFAAILAVHQRRQIHGWQFVLSYGVFGIIGNLYRAIVPANVWIGTCIFIIANSGLVLFLWNWDRWRR